MYCFAADHMQYCTSYCERAALGLTELLQSGRQAGRRKALKMSSELTMPW